MPEVISPGQRKRISRIRRRAISAVRQAYENGLISARKADDLLYLPRHRQAEELAALIAERETRERTAQLAAETINDYLEGNSGKVDLVELGQRIRGRLAAG